MAQSAFPRQINTMLEKGTGSLTVGPNLNVQLSHFYFCALTTVHYLFNLSLVIVSAF